MRTSTIPGRIRPIIFGPLPLRRAGDPLRQTIYSQDEQRSHEIEGQLLHWHAADISHRWGIRPMPPVGAETVPGEPNQEVEDVGKEQVAVGGVEYQAEPELYDNAKKEYRQLNRQVLHHRLNLLQVLHGVLILRRDRPAGGTGWVRAGAVVFLRRHGCLHVHPASRLKDDPTPLLDRLLEGGPVVEILAGAHENHIHATSRRILVMSVRANNGEAAANLSLGANIRPPSGEIVETMLVEEAPLLFHGPFSQPPFQVAGFGITLVVGLIDLAG